MFNRYVFTIDHPIKDREGFFECLVSDKNVLFQHKIADDMQSLFMVDNGSPIIIDTIILKKRGEACQTSADPGLVFKLYESIVDKFGIAIVPFLPVENLTKKYENQYVDLCLERYNKECEHLSDQAFKKGYIGYNPAIQKIKQKKHAVVQNLLKKVIEEQQVRAILEKDMVDGKLPKDLF